MKYVLEFIALAAEDADTLEFPSQLPRLTACVIVFPPHSG